MNADLKTPVRKIIELLVAKEYEAVANLISQQRLDSTSIRNAITDYGRTLTLPPPSVLDSLDVVQIKGFSPKRWSVWVNLWTVEEGRSDLSVELTLIQSKDDFLIELDNIHVH